MNQEVWSDGQTRSTVPVKHGKGERMIISPVVGSSGFVPGVDLIILVRESTQEYHGEMNADIFFSRF